MSPRCLLLALLVIGCSEPPPPDGAGGGSGAAGGGRASGGGMASGGGGGAAGGASCGDTMTDPDDCGRCNHSCLGGQCVGGVCQPVRLSNVPGYPHALVLSPTHVYFTERRGMQPSHVFRVPIATGTTTDLGTVPTIAGGLELAGTDVYVAVGEVNQVYRIPQAGGMPVALVGANDGGAPKQLVIDGNRIIFANGRSTLASIPLGGGPVTDVATIGYQAQGLSLSGGVLYYATFGSPGVVGRVELTGADAGKQTPLTSQPNAFDTVATATHLYFTAYADGEYVYWTNFAPEGLNLGPAEGSVNRVRLDGGLVETLASGLNGPYDVAVDGQAVYWVSRWGSAVYKLARP